MAETKTIDIAKLVTAVESERAKFTKLLVAENRTVPKPSYFSMHNLDAFGINVVAMSGKKRKSGVPYMVHPATSAFIISKLAAGKLMDQAISYALFHDLIDEALEYNPQKFAELKTKYGAEFAKEFNAAIILCSPHREVYLRNQPNSHMARKYAEKVAEVEQVRASGDKAIALALIADKIDGMLDLDYLKDSSFKEVLVQRWHVAFPYFAAKELEGMLPPGTRELVEKLADDTCNRYGCSVTAVVRDSQTFNDASRGMAAEIAAQIKLHQINFGYRS